MSAVSLPCAPQAVHLVFGWRSMLALAGYLVMQVGLWKAENKWDEEGSAAYLKAAGKKSDDTPETLEGMLMGDVTIPADELKAAFPVPCGGSSSAGGSGASATCSLWTARRTLSDQFRHRGVMNRLGKKKKVLSLLVLAGWITLGVMSALDVLEQLDLYYAARGQR